MTTKFKNTILIYLTTFLMTIIVGYVYLAQSDKVYSEELTYEMTDHKIKDNNNDKGNAKVNNENVTDTNIVIGSFK